MRINQFVAAASGLSRRAADTAITAGRVTIAGRAASLGAAVTPGAADIRLDGQPLNLPAAHTYLMLHKPVGYVSSRRRQGQAPTLYDLLPPQYHALRITGRLDRDSSGLVILTDDGAFIQAHTHPSAGKIKVYDITLHRPLSAGDRDHLARGVELADGPSHLTVELAHGRRIRVSLREGRNRHIRRTFGALGHTVERLHRLQMGSYQLDTLAAGQFKTFEPII